MRLDPADFYTGEGAEKVAAAQARFTLEEARTPEDFAVVWAQLFAAFGPTGEIEREETLRSWFSGSRSPPDADIRTTYHMVLARDRDGALAGVRDCFVTFSRRTLRSVVLLSHSLVLPLYRRSGLAAVLRTVPVPLARRTDPSEILLVAEMELVDPAARDTVIRLLAYGKAGYAVIPPDALPYAQPDFREPAGMTAGPVPLPFLLLVRQVGEEDRPTLSRARALAMIEHMQAIHSCHCHPADLVPIRENALRALDAYPRDELPLLRATSVEAMEPLLQSVVLPLYPAPWRAPYTPGTPEAERAALRATWSP